MKFKKNDEKETKDVKNSEKEPKEKLTLTLEEKEALKGNEEGIRQTLLSKAVLAEARKNGLSEEEEEELEYLYNTEKSKFFIARQIQDKISIDADEVVKIYNENKAQFDSQNIPFTQAREIIQRDLQNQQVVNLENEELAKIFKEMGDSVSLDKKEVLFAMGNPNIISNMIINKIVGEKIQKANFEEKEKDELKILRDIVLRDYILFIFNCQANISYIFYFLIWSI